MAAEQTRPVTGSGLGPAFAAVRVRLGLVLALFALAAVGWWWTVGQMQGMDEGPWTSLGAFGWFLGVWVVMMAAMMFPSVAPTVALYSRMTKTRLPLAPAAFTAGYLLTWATAGVAAWTIALATGHLAGDALAWDNAGRWLAGATVIVAAVGAKNGAWCVGCCWALMAALFALGVMSITWMAIVAGLIAIEKTLPWRRIATYTAAAVLLVLGVLILTSPHAIPWLTLPDEQPMPMMTPHAP